MRSILVTGGAGFIGVNFVRYWLRRHPKDRLIVLDALTYAGNLASLAGLLETESLRFVHGSINDFALARELVDKERIDTVVNLAAESHVDRSIAGPDAFVETNIVGTHNLLKAARECWGNVDGASAQYRFHHISTDEVFGSLSHGEPAFEETTAYAPNSPYAASKASSDHLVRAYHHTYGLPVTTSNCSNNYGPYQFPEKLIPLMIINFLQGKPLPVYGDGRNVRDWLYVEDHCRGIELVLEKGIPGETYNLGGNSERANIDVVRRLCAALDEAFANDPALSETFPAAPPARGETGESLINFVADRPGHDYRYAINSGKAATELGFAPSETFDGGMQKTIHWYLHNVEWWQAVMSGEYRRWMKEQYGT